MGESLRELGFRVFVLPTWKGRIIDVCVGSVGQIEDSPTVVKNSTGVTSSQPQQLPIASQSRQQPGEARASGKNRLFCALFFLTCSAVTRN